MQEGSRGIMGREWIKTEPDSSGGMGSYRFIPTLKL